MRPSPTALQRLINYSNGQLTKLAIPNCLDLEKAALQGILAQPLPRLRHLELGNPKKLPDNPSTWSEIPWFYPPPAACETLILENIQSAFIDRPLGSLPMTNLRCFKLNCGALPSLFPVRLVSVQDELQP